jgi:hypothetical protein
MKRNPHVLAAAALAIALVAAGCGGSSDSGTKTTGTAPTTATSATSATTSTSSPATMTTAAGGDLQSLIPTPANTQRTDGPDPIQENGIHKHFLVNGSPAETMNAYKTALEGAGWSLTVETSGGGGGGGGATYTGTKGDAYGVFTGGGYGATTDVNSFA